MSRPESRFDHADLCDDEPEFDRPWNPGTLMIITFFGGLLAGGILIALNFRRLGFKRGAKRTLAASILYTIAAISLAGWLAADRMKERRKEQQLDRRVQEVLDEVSREPYDPDRTQEILREAREAIAQADEVLEDIRRSEERRESGTAYPDAESDAEPDAETPTDLFGSASRDESGDDSDPESALSESAETESALSERESDTSRPEGRSSSSRFEDQKAAEEKRKKRDRDFRSLVMYSIAIGGVLIAWLIARPQFRRYQWALSEGVKTGPLFFPALGAISLSLGVLVVGVVLVVIVLSI